MIIVRLGGELVLLARTGMVTKIIVSRLHALDQLILTTKTFSARCSHCIYQSSVAPISTSRPKRKAAKSVFCE